MLASVMRSPNASGGGAVGAGGALGRDQRAGIVVGLGDAVQGLVAVEVRMNIVHVGGVKGCSRPKDVVLLRCEERRRHLDGRRNFGEAIWLSP